MREEPQLEKSSVLAALRKERKQAIDAQLTELLAKETQQASVSGWRKAQRLLKDMTIGDVWDDATPAEQRALVAGVFSGVLADEIGATFQVRELEIELTPPWWMSGIEVAGPGIEPGTP
jgi:hypothetical protein